MASDFLLEATLGAAFLPSDDWQADDVIDLSTAFEWGINFVTEPFPGSPLLIQTGFAGARAEDDIEGFTFQSRFSRLSWGLRTNVDRRGFTPYLMGGATYVDAELEVVVGESEEEFDDSGVGGFLGGGVHTQLIPGIFIGAEFRFDFVHVEFDRHDLSAGGAHVSGLIGFGF
jgi:opacity protein-like surface antigen